MASHVHVVEDDPELRDLILRGLSEEGFDVAGERRRRDGVAPPGRAPGRRCSSSTSGSRTPTAAISVRPSGPEACTRPSSSSPRSTPRPTGYRASARAATTTSPSPSPSASSSPVSTRCSADRIPGIAPIPSALHLDPARRTVRCGEASVELTQTEYRILGALAGRPGETLRRLEIVGAAWPPGAIVSENTIDAYIARLRRKLRSLPVRSRDRDGARRRLHASMKPRRTRGIRARLLSTNAVVMLLALVALTVASNAILRRSLDGNASNLVRARAGAGLATLRPKGDGLRVIESPDDAAIDAQIWVFDKHGTVEAPAPSSATLDRRAAALAGGPQSDRRRGRHALACSAGRARRQAPRDAGCRRRPRSLSRDGPNRADGIDRPRRSALRRRHARVALDLAACARAGLRDDAGRGRLERAQSGSPVRAGRALRRALESRRDARRAAGAPRQQPSQRAALLVGDVARAADAPRADPHRGRARLAPGAKLTRNSAKRWRPSGGAQPRWPARSTPSWRSRATRGRPRADHRTPARRSSTPSRPYDRRATQQGIQPRVNAPRVNGVRLGADAEVVERILAPVIEDGYRHAALVGRRRRRARGHVGGHHRDRRRRGHRCHRSRAHLRARRACLTA